jgi:hypothetical protein
VIAFRQRVFPNTAATGHGAVTKILERRCVMLGLHTPQTAVLLVDQTAPKETSIDKIERVLADLAAEAKNDDTTTHPTATGRIGPLRLEADFFVIN